MKRIKSFLCAFICISYTIQYIPQEERHPAEHENAHNDAQRARSLMFSFHFDQMFVFGRRMLLIHFVQGQRFRRTRSA